MAVQISNTNVNEATPGVTIGTLSGGSNYSVHSNFQPYYQINNNILSLTANYYFDFETKNFTKNTSAYNDFQQLTSRGSSYTSYFGNPPVLKILSGSDEVDITITVVNKDETITITPKAFKQNQYGAIIAEIVPTDNYFSGKKIYYEGPSFFEISGNNLKLRNDTYYSETGKIQNSSYELNLLASDFTTVDSDSNSKPDNDFYFTLLSGRTGGQIGETGISNDSDLGFTKYAASTYINTIFGSNVNKTPDITLAPNNFVERDFGAIVGTINFTNSGVSFSLENHNLFELSGQNKIKLKDSFYYEKSDQSIRDESSIYFLSNISNSKLELTASDTTTNAKLSTELIPISEITSSIFGSSNVDGTPQITITPIKFNDKKMGAVIGKINYSGSETNVTFTVNNQFLELSGTNNIKIKDEFFFDLNRLAFVKQDQTTYKNISSSVINILAKDSVNSKNLAIEKPTIGDITSSVFGSSNVNNLDESYTYVTDIKYQAPTLGLTGRKEYQKNIIDHWVLNEGEKISYSFLEPGAAYVGNYNEMKGLISPSTAFKTAATNAFNVISTFADITFENISESGSVVGDFRIGIVDKDHFAMSSEYAAYSQGVGNLPQSGNIFFNGEKNFNEASTYNGKSGAFTTFLHEILHSLGQKHPFESIAQEGSANIYENKYEQYPYTVMSYTPLRDTNTYSTKYDGIVLKSGAQYYPYTPMLFDVRALQEIYGAAKSNNPGDTTYTFTPSEPPFQSLYDTGGNDVLDLSAVSGGSEIDLSGETVSVIGNDLIKPFKNQTGQPTTFGDPQGAPLGIIPGTKIEKIILPDGPSTITSGPDTTYIVGKANYAITANMKSTELGVKASGSADDTINLKQTTTKWTGDFQAINKGNNGVGATEEKITDMTSFLKHDLSVNLDQGTDTIKGTSGNDALFLQNFGTTGDSLYFQEAGSNKAGSRLLGVDKVDLLEGNNFLDLTSTTQSLAGNNITITAGTGNDILWLSDANENVSTGNGNDQITVNGGTDTLTTNLGDDIITISKNSGQLTISDFDISKDRFIFKVAQNKISISNNQLTIDNEDPIGDYTIILSNLSSISNLSDYSTFA